MPTTKPFLHGIVPPVATPYTADHQIDWKSLARLLKHLLDGGVHGLFLLGSTSECVFLSSDERARLLEFCVKEVGGRVPLVSGIMDATTDSCIHHGLRAKAAGVDGLVVTAPFYTRTNQTETIDHFRYIRQATAMPLVAYDIPVCVGMKLQRETLHTMVEEDLIVAIKDSSGDEGTFRMLLQDFKDKPGFALLTGSEVVADSAILAGAHGCVPGLGNVDPAGYVRLYEAASQGRLAEARAEQERLIKLFQMVFWSAPRLSGGAGGVGSFKVALKHMGIFDNGDMRRPNRPVPDDISARIADHVKSMGLV